jgi:hypothetical protein
MSGSTTDQLVEAIAELRLLFPDWRMGQLVANLALASGSTDPGGIWEIEDEHMLAAAHSLIERNRGRTETSAKRSPPPDRGGITSSSASTTPQPPRKVS